MFINNYYTYICLFKVSVPLWQDFQNEVIEMALTLTITPVNRTFNIDLLSRKAYEHQI